MKYVYMIDYEDKQGFDQVECYTQSEVLEELKYLSSKQEVNILDVKLVEDNNREHEEWVSYSFGKEVISILGYIPRYLNWRNKGERL